MKRSLLVIVASLAMAMMSMMSVAADTPKQALLKQLNQLQILTYDTTSNFLSYTLEDNKNPYNSTQYYVDNKKSSADGSTLANAIDSAVSSLSLKSVKPIQPLWATYDGILNNDQLPLVAPGGVLDTFNIQELVKARNALISDLDVIRKEIESDSPAIRVMALAEARAIKEIAMTYTAKTSPTQGTYMAIDAKFDLKAESQKVSTLFDSMLAEAQKNNNTAQVAIIKEAKTNWDFIAPVLSSDKKVQASYIVTIYSTNINKLLEQL